ATTAIAPPMSPEDFFDGAGQRFGARFVCPFQIAVEATSADLQNRTQNGDGKVFRLAFNEPKNLLQVCRLKMLKAFFKMSRSVSVCLSLALSSRISCSSAEPFCFL